MPDHPNAAQARDVIRRMNQGDQTAGFDVLADDVVWHEIGRPEPIRGKSAVIERLTSMPDGGGVAIELHDAVANDEHTITLINATATWGDRTLEYRVAEIYHLRDGRVVERWAFSDDTERISRFFSALGG